MASTWRAGLPAFGILFLVPLLCYTPADAGTSLRLAVCGTTFHEYQAKSFVGTYLALEYWRRGPPDLQGLIKPASSDLDIEITPIKTACSAMTAFKQAVPVFMHGEAVMPHAVIGCHCSHASVSVARFSTTYRVPQILVGSDLSDLSDKTEFPYVFRACPVDVADADVHAAIVSEFGLRYVTVLYIDQPISRRQKERFLSRRELKDAEATIVRFPDLDFENVANQWAIKAKLPEIMSSKSWTMVCYFASTVNNNGNGIWIMYIMRVAQIANGNTAWLFTEEQTVRLAWLATHHDVEHIWVAIKGAFMVREMPVYPRFQTWQAWVAANVNAAKISAAGFNGSVADPVQPQDAWFTTPSELPTETAIRFDATIFVLLAAQALVDEGATSIEHAALDAKMRSLGRDQSFQGLYGPLGLDKNLDRTGLTFAIFQAKVDFMTSFLPPVGVANFVRNENGTETVVMLDSALVAETPALGPNFAAPDCPAGYSKAMPFMPPMACQPCAAGRYSSAAFRNICLDCRPGEFSASNASVRCDVCNAGEFSDQTGAVACSPCKEGSMASTSGSKQCDFCVPGRFMTQQGASECDRCPLGTYANVSGTSEACASCPPKKSTALLGAVNALDCKCESGTFESKGACVPCPFAMDCAGGEDSPTVRRLYWASVEKPYEAYLCAGYNLCQGGKPGNLCGPGQQGFLCNTCVEGYFRRWSMGVCLECSTVDRVLFVLALMLFVLSPLPVHFSTKMLIGQRVHSEIVFLSGLMGQVVTYSQLLAMVGSFKVSWPNEIVSIFNVVSLFLLDAKLLAPQCSTLAWGFDEEYPFVLLLPCIFTAVYGSHYLGSVLLEKLAKLQVRLSEACLVNSCGRIFLLFHVSITKSAARFFECYDHPEGRGSSMIEYPDVLCWTGDHLKMIPLVILALSVYCVGVFACILWVVWQAPKRFVQQEFVRRYGFLLMKFRPDRWYWSVVIFSRNTILAFLVACIPNFPVVQAVIFNVILLATVCMNSAYSPWMTRYNNQIELMLTILIIIFSLSAMPLAPNASQTVPQLAVCLMTASVLVLLLLIRILGITLYRSFQQLNNYKASENNRLRDPSGVVPTPNRGSLSGNREVGVMDTNRTDQLKQLHRQMADRLFKVVVKLQQLKKSELEEMISMMNVYDKQVVNTFVRLICVAHLQEGFGPSSGFFSQRLAKPPPTQVQSGNVTEGSSSSIIAIPSVHVAQIESATSAASAASNASMEVSLSLPFGSPALSSPNDGQPTSLAAAEPPLLVTSVDD